MKKRSMLLVLLMMLVSATVAQAQEPATEPVAQETPTTTTATTSARSDEVLVIATRTSLPAFDTPYATDSVGADQFQQRQYRTTPRALMDVPGVMVQETSTGQGSPYLRGFTSQRTVLMIDGIRLNNSVFREGPNQYWGTVDAFSIDRYEVVRGPASVLYGSDAIGGAVNALTLNPYAYGQSDHWAGRTLYRYHSGEDSHIGRVEGTAAMVNDQLGFIIGTTLKEFGDTYGGEDVGRQLGTGYEEYDVDIKAEYWQNPDTRWTVAHQRVRINDAARTHRTFDAVLWEGTGPPGTGGSSGSPNLREQFDQERELTYVQLHAENIDSFIDAAHFSISHQHQGEVRDRTRPMPVRNDFQGFDVETLGLSASLESDSDFGRWTYGLEYYRDWVSSFSTSDAIQGPVADDAGYDLLGLYAQNEYHWTDRLSTIIGGRFTLARAQADSVNDGNDVQVSVEDTYTAFVGSGRILYAIIPEQLNIFGGISQGFRAPNLMDLTASDEFGSGSTQVGSPSVDPERFNNFELGLKSRDEDWNAELVYFYTMIDDMIVRAQRSMGASEFDALNAGEGYVNGIEFAAAYRLLPSLTAFGNLTWQEGHLEQPTFSTGGETSRQYLSRTAPLGGIVGLRFEPVDQKFWVEGLVRLAKRQDLLAPNDVTDNRIPPEGTPGYVVASIYGGYKPCNYLTLNLGVENLTDEDYRIHGSGQNMPGLSFVFSIEVNF